MRPLRNFKTNQCCHLISRIANRAFFLNDEEKTVLMNMANVSATNADWRALGGKIVVGDSGNPAFLLNGNEPILLYCLHAGGVGRGPSVFHHRKEIQKAMDELCPGYKLEAFDFSKVRCDDVGRWKQQKVVL